MRPGGRIVTFSSGAAIGGSPLSGGYAGAKATQRFISNYAQSEAVRAGLDLSFTSVLPLFAPDTGVGGPAVEAYAARAGVPIGAFLKTIANSTGTLVSPGIAGAAVLDLVTRDAAQIAPAYRLTGSGLERLP